jgi:Ca-activated chloride channel family protein
MDLKTTLDVDLVAVETADEVAVLLDLTAPTTTAPARPPHTLEVVLDRSGSMAGERLDAAKQALEALLVRLDPSDAFGLVAFDDDVQIVVPAGPLGDKSAAAAAIRSLQPSGMTNLSGGLLRGLQEARRAAAGRGATLLMLSDGHANVGILGHGELQAVAATGRREGVTTSTIGLGLDYDEALLAALATGGAGATHFALDGDAAGAAVAEEVGHLLEQVAQAVSLVVRAADGVPAFTLWNDLPVSGIDDGVMVELGDFHAGEHRRILLGFQVPGMPGPGAARICELEFRWVDLVSMTEKVATVPVNVNVVPGDVAAGRVPEATVREELAFLKLQRAKRGAAERLSRGDGAGGARLMREAAAAVLAVAAAPELLAEAALLESLAGECDVRVAAKALRADVHGAAAPELDSVRREQPRLRRSW